MIRHSLFLAFVAALSAIAGLPSARAQETSAQDVPAPPTRWLVLGGADARARRPFNPSAHFARHLIRRDSPPPEEGQTLKGSVGTAHWTAITTGEDGTLQLPEGSTVAHASVDVPRDLVVLATLKGIGTAWVNGSAFAGDVYDQRIGPTPIPLRKGRNQIHLAGLRGPVSLKWTLAPAGPLRANPEGAVLPDAGLPDTFLSVPVWNLTSTWTERQPIVLRPGDGKSGRPLTQGDLISLAPYSVDRPVFVLMDGLPPASEGEDATLTLVAAGAALGALQLPALRTDGVQLYTFVSNIDGSAQQWALRGPPPPEGNPRLVDTILSLHGAGVAARAQARAYEATPGFRMVCPTNRHVYGFDWQDWGRHDAYEVLADAMERTGGDPRRVHLTGHSMGGHGTWHLAANDPDRWLSVAPSAGWQSFDTYGGRPRVALSEPWQGADRASCTSDLASNLAPLPTYVLHGDADEVVPLDEARNMLTLLERFGGKPLHHFEPGAGHWWVRPDKDFAACLHWPGFFKMFAAARPIAPPNQLSFITVDPVVDAQHHWIRVEQFEKYGLAARVTAERSPETGEVVLDTVNVRRLVILGAKAGEEDHRVLVDGRWTSVEGGTPIDEKRPGRGGPFKRAFHGRFLLVVGTAGTPEEDAELLDRARYDSAVWSYRARGRAPIVRDTDVLEGNLPSGEHNLILYGNADTNAAWNEVLPEVRPVDAKRGSLRVGSRTFEGDDLAMAFVLPRRGSDVALVGAFADTGPAGSRLGYLMQPFTSGVGYPDYTVFGPAVMDKGEDGVLAAGWFDHRWRLPE
jgi:pimeloyl-ACP methyl ester carboxylesterase